MENTIPYTFVDSPASDRLVINFDDNAEKVETTITNPQTKTNQSPVSPPNSSFSMNRLLGDSENQQDLRQHPSMEHLLPRIHDTFDLYSSTSIADSLSRIFNLGDTIQHLLPTGQVHHLDNQDTATDLTHKPNPTTNTHKKKKDAKGQAQLEKPPYTYVGLIVVAIDSSPEKMLTLADVRSKLISWFPFFNGPYTGWKSSVRHTVSSHCCFYKVRQVENSRSYLWAVNYENVRPALLVRQNRSTFTTDLFSQYKYNLHEQVGVPAVQYPAKHESSTTKPPGLKLPCKPSFEHSHDILTSTTNDLISGRNDDALSQNGDTVYQHCPSHKRKTDTLSHEEQRGNVKRKKTLAVNPTPSTDSFDKEQPTESTFEITETTSSKPTEQQNHYYLSVTETPYYHEEATNCTFPAQENYYPQQWPLLHDTLALYPSLYNNNYQHCHNYQNHGYIYQQQPTIPTYTTWPHNMYTQGYGYYNYNGYWNQMVDPTSVPVNLSKQSDTFSQ